MGSVAFGFPTGSLTGLDPSNTWIDPVPFTGDPNQLSNVDLTTPAPSPNGTFVDLGNGEAFVSPDAMGQMFDSNGNPVRANNGAGTAPAIQSVAGIITALGNLALGFFKALNPPKSVIVQAGTPQRIGGTTAQVTSTGQVLRPPVVGTGSGSGLLLVGIVVIGAVVLLK